MKAVSTITITLCCISALLVAATSAVHKGGNDMDSTRNTMRQRRLNEEESQSSSSRSTPSVLKAMAASDESGGVGYVEVIVQVELFGILDPPAIMQNVANAAGGTADDILEKAGLMLVTVPAERVATLMDIPGVRYVINNIHYCAAFLYESNE